MIGIAAGYGLLSIPLSGWKIDNGVATLIAGLVGFGGIGGVAWYNGYQGRIIADRERKARAKEHADILYSELIQLHYQMQMARIRLLEDKVNIDALLFAIGSASRPFSSSRVSAFNNPDFARGLPNPILTTLAHVRNSSEILHVMGGRLRNQEIRKDGFVRLKQSITKQCDRGIDKIDLIISHLPQHFGDEYSPAELIL